MSRRKQTKTPTRTALTDAEALVQTARINRSSAIIVAVVAALKTIAAAIIGAWVLLGG